MRCIADHAPGRRGRASRIQGFTLAEALAALAFMAIVIPVAVEGVRVANLAGVVATRKSAAARVADRVLNDMVVTKAWQQSGGGGQVVEDDQTFRWTSRSQSWEVDAIRLVTVEVEYQVQGKDYQVRLSSLVDSSQ